MQRVRREEERDEDARRQASRCSRKDEEEERGVRRVQYDVRQMMRRRVEAGERDDRHVRQPREGMPGAGRGRRERPRDAVRGQTALHLGILGDVQRIVVVQKRRAAERQEENDRTSGDRQAGDWQEARAMRWPKRLNCRDAAAGARR